ncbi:MAG: adenosine deaminase [Aquabacterium sp.]
MPTADLAPTQRPGPSRAALQALPKVELHCHLLGTVQRATFEDLVREAGAPIGADDIDGFFLPSARPVGAIRVLRALEQRLLRRPAHFHRIAYEYLCEAAAHGVRHAELSWNPTGTAAVPGLTYAQVLPALRAAFADARRDAGIQALLIPAIDREAGAQAALEMAQWVVDAPCDEVRGIGIDYREAEGPPERFADAYALARRAGLKATAHAGEFGLPWVNVQSALDLLHCDRIDHGYTVVDHPPLLQRCRERGVVFTVVPTNSYYRRTLAPQRWALDHPIRAMLAAGLAIHPNTDDPTLHQVTPTGAWAMMTEHFGAGWSDVRRMLQAGLAGAWIDDVQRRRWASEWAAECDALQAADEAAAAAGPPPPTPNGN